MLVALEKSTHKRVETLSFNSGFDIRKAFDKDNLICPFCEQTVFPRDRENYILHFAHKSICSSPFEYHPESIEHILGKKIIKETLSKQLCLFDIEILLEFPIPEAGKKGRIADVVAIFPSGFMMIYECQLSYINTEEVYKRTQDYESIGSEVTWLLGKSADIEANRNWCYDYFDISYGLQFCGDRSELLSSGDNFNKKIIIVYRTESTEGRCYETQFRISPSQLVLRELEIWNALTNEQIRNGLGAITENAKRIVAGAIGSLNSKGIIQKQNDKWQIIREKLAIENIVPFSEEAIKKARKRAKERKLLKEKNLDISDIYNTS
jgi:competence protein CoiA